MKAHRAYFDEAIEFPLPPTHPDGPRRYVEPPAPTPTTAAEPNPPAPVDHEARLREQAAEIGFNPDKFVLMNRAERRAAARAARRRTP